jgi:cysteinyl-tRNA synthetase
MLRLHDTATGQVSELALREPGKVSLYVCGSTVYDVPHIGHGRFTLVFDILRRYLEFCGLDVDHVSNVTDIDDKIIKRANQESCDWKDIANEYEAAWWEGMDALGALRPTSAPHATDYIAEMITLISQLVSREVAYETADGVYLSVSHVDGYGLLARQSLDSLRSGARVAIDEEKRSPLDFALWKKAKPGEPTWDSPWGPGRPGWHTECVVMALGLLGEGFDLHGGGQDLAFPHHENERAQAVALGLKFCNHWMHNGMVEVGGAKMAKSLGNFTTIAELLQGTDPRAYRMLVARSHYRSPIEVTPATIADAERALDRLDAFARRFADQITGGDGTDELDPEVRASFIERMEDDLDTAGAVAVLFDAVRRANAAADADEQTSALGLARSVIELARVLGIELAGTSLPDATDVRHLAERREQARAERDFALADALRAEIAALGWNVEDTPEGPRLYR